MTTIWDRSPDAYRRTSKRQATIGDPCAAVKADGDFCLRKSVAVIHNDAYCTRHATMVRKVRA